MSKTVIDRARARELNKIRLKQGCGIAELARSVGIKLETLRAALIRHGLYVPKKFK